MNKIRGLQVALVLIMLVSVLSASTFDNLSSALKMLCSGIKNLIPIVSFLMVVAAGVVYAAGQLLGAETRARASVWATAMLIGAVIGLLIYAVAPTVLNALYGGGIDASVC